MPITAARRRHQPVRPVDRPRASSSIAASTSCASSTSTRPAVSAGVQPGVVLDQLNRAAAAARPAVRPRRRHREPGQPRRHDRQQLRRLALHRLRQDHRPRPPPRRHSRRRQPCRVRAADARPSGTAGPIARSLEGAIYRGVRTGRASQRARRFASGFPRILRRVSGYNLDAFVARRLSESNGWPDDRDAGLGLHQLVIGSEGTLAVVTEAELNLVPRPKARGLLVPHFASLAAAMDALAACLEFGPSAVELMDQLLHRPGPREPGAAATTMAAVQGRPAALFMVEFSGDDPAEVADRIEKLRAPAARRARPDRRWCRRSSRPCAIRCGTCAVPRCRCCYGMPGDRKPVTFVEDTAVAPERLPEFVARFREILHAARHRRRVLRPRQRRLPAHPPGAEPQGRRRRGPDAADHRGRHRPGPRVRRLALSGEHGDGLARSEWNRKMFGDDGLRGLPPGQARLRSAQPAQPRQDRRCAGR